MEEKQNPGEALMNQMQIMNGIVREMKEIPELPSEVATDKSSLEKVEFPDEGGMLTYMSGHDYPYRGFPYFEIVEKIDLIKKISRAAVSGLYHSLKRKKYWLFTLIPSIWVVKNFAETGIYTFYRLVERFKLKPQRYSRSIRELHRAFSIPRGEDTHTQELRLMLRDLVCMILEFDNAYRFRVQDWIEDLDQVAVKKNPIKEISRVLTIAQSRELTAEIKDTWTLAKLGVSVYLRFDRKLKNVLADILASIDKEQFKLTPEDKHFTARRKDYAFSWITDPKNNEDRLIIELDTINRKHEAGLKNLEDAQLKVHQDLDTQYTNELAKISPSLTPEIIKWRNEKISTALKNLREETILREQAIINVFKTPEQIKLMEDQFKEREAIKIAQKKEIQDKEDKLKILKDELRNKYK